MTDTSPVAREKAVVPAVAAGADDTTMVARAPFAGTVAGVTYAPDAAITGADTNSRTCSVANRGQAGSGSTNVASKAFTNGVNAAAGDETAITLNGTAANLVVAEGDVLAWTSLHVGTGLADPGGMVEITFQRTYA